MGAGSSTLRLVPPTNPARLRNLLLGLLDSAEGWVTDVGRTFVSQGRPLPECEALVVWCESISASSPNKAACQVIPRAFFHVTLYECGEMTSSASAIESDALHFADHGWAIWAGILTGFRDGTLFGEDASVACSQIDLARGMTAIAPQENAGIGGWDATIIVDL